MEAAARVTPAIVVDDLGDDVLGGAEDGQARTGRGALDLLADPTMTTVAAQMLLLGDAAHEDLLTGLAGLADDVLALVADALALVRLGLAEVADLGGHLADPLLVDATHDDLRGCRHLEADAVGCGVVDRVAVAERQLEGVVALGRGAVADADDLELLGELVGDAFDHVGHERTDEAVQRPVGARVVGTLDEERVAVLAQR